MSVITNKIQQVCSYLSCFKETYEIDGKRYTVRELLGEGGFSTVYLVTEVGTNRVFALKKIRCHSSEDEKTALDEIGYHRKIRHVSLIECLGSSVIGKADITNNKISSVMILLPFYKQGTLQHCLDLRAKTSNHLPESLIFNYFRQICEGLEAIHKAGFAHRDLKPANILLGPGDRVVIMDFGSMAPAKVDVANFSAAQKLQDEAAERCSMTYRAPELFNVQSPAKIDERIDIWSLGCLLYAMCFFKSPFDEVYERGDSVALAVSSGISSFPRNSASYSQNLLDLIHKLLITDHSQRPFIDEVLRCLETVNNKK